jgi:4'-phosphopantetheinyl transferase
MSGGRQIGVDVEAIRTDLDIAAVAQSHFSSREVDVLMAMTPPERTAAFFRCWTRKEAYVKARGEGLGFPLGQFAVAFGPDESPGVRWVADDPEASEHWAMFDLAPASGYAGALVVDRPPVRLLARRCVAPG